MSGEAVINSQHMVTGFASVTTNICRRHLLYLTFLSKLIPFFQCPSLLYFLRFCFTSYLPSFYKSQDLFFLAGNNNTQSWRHQGCSIKHLFAFEVHVSLLAVWFGAIVWQPSLECPTHPSSVICIPGVRPIT